jgi:NAD(P)H-hydrate epimerase
MPEGSGRYFSPKAMDAALELIGKCDAAAIGPGFGRAEETIKFVHELLPQIDKPMVVDADGLYAIAQDTSIFKKIKAPIIITPHPGEMARLSGTGARDIQSNRLKNALKAAEQFGAIVVLKGARTLICSPDGRTFVNPTGTVAMASGGTGDVLTGVIGALLAAGLEPMDAAVCGVYMHGYAGELAAGLTGKAGTVASDVVNSLPEAIMQLSRENDR